MAVDTAAAVGILLAAAIRPKGAAPCPVAAAPAWQTAAAAWLTGVVGATPNSPAVGEAVGEHEGH